MRPGEPIQVSEQQEAIDQKPASTLCKAMAITLKAYNQATRDLLAIKYASVRDAAPPHLRAPCHTYVVCCLDGIIVRYDAAGEKTPRVFCTDLDQPLSAIAPGFSEFVMHVPDDPSSYVPEHKGPSISQVFVNADGQATEQARIHPVLYASKGLPADFQMPSPPARPPCLASMHCELELNIQGTVLPANTPAKAIRTAPENLLARAVVALPVGWKAIEIYPRLREEYWRPEYAAAWAEQDLLGAIAQRNLAVNALHRLDGRRDFKVCSPVPRSPAISF
jgi:hypothetical protein